MVAVVRFLLAVVFVLVVVFAIPSAAAPPSDVEQQYRLLSHYMNQYNSPDFDLNGLLFADQRSIKRGLGPRPLRFG
ncbi:hypothetical protein QR680_005210 [Steinernema hermaphroditum]|uniref:Uncharacterized protein n=1 Tax=Steinernema hermaphroditum TaxID=289476 RepID=A0AA39LUY0_9BILA|nr:hypothetical protein QR680_005210 [Steinernema hermaphroditum]